MDRHDPPSAADIVARLATNTTIARTRWAIGGCGLFFLACSLGLAIALLTATPPSALLWVAPLSLLVGVGGTALFIRWGAATMMVFLADSSGAIRVVLGKNAVRHMSKRIGQPGYLVRQFGIGLLVVAIFVVCMIGLALLGAGAEMMTAVLALPLAWLGVIVSGFMLRTAWSLSADDIPVDGAIVAPLAAVYLREGGSLSRLADGVPADEIIDSVSASSLQDAATVSAFISRFT